MGQVASTRAEKDSLGTKQVPQSVYLGIQTRRAIGRVKKYFSSKKDVLAVYLYGSQASGKATPRSDVDLAVVLNSAKHAFERELKFRTDLEKLLGKEVDVAILNGADLFLASQAFTKGKLLFTRNRKKSEDFKWRTMKLYWDFIPTKRIFDETAFQKLKRY